MPRHEAVLVCAKLPCQWSKSSGVGIAFSFLCILCNRIVVSSCLLSYNAEKQYNLITNSMEILKMLRLYARLNHQIIIIWVVSNSDLGSIGMKL